MTVRLIPVTTDMKLKQWKVKCVLTAGVSRWCRGNRWLEPLKGIGTEPECKLSAWPVFQCETWCRWDPNVFPQPPRQSWVLVPIGHNTQEPTCLLNLYRWKRKNDRQGSFLTLETVVWHTQENLNVQLLAFSRAFKHFSCFSSADGFWTSCMELFKVLYALVRCVNR